MIHSVVIEEGLLIDWSLSVCLWEKERESRSWGEGADQIDAMGIVSQWNEILPILSSKEKLEIICGGQY